MKIVNLLVFPLLIALNTPLLAYDQLTLGQPLTGQTLKLEGDTKWYQVPIQAGQKIYVVLDKGSSAYTYMSIKEGGLPDRGSYYTRSDQAVELQGQTGGYCYVRVEFWRTYLSDPNSTTFTITAYDVTTFPTLRFGQTLSRQTLKLEGDTKWYQVPIQAGQKVYVVLDKGSSAYTYMSIKDDGLPVTGSYYTRSDQAVELQGQTGGYCYVRVEFWRTYLSDPDSTTFTITAYDVTTFPTLRFGQTSSRQTLKLEGDTKWYQIPVQAGQKVYVVLDKGSSAYTYMSIKDDGLPVTGSYYTRSDQAVELQGQTGGYCYVRVEFWRTYLSDSDSTIFTITAYDVSTFPTLTSGQTLSGQKLKVDGDVKWYQVPILAGQKAYVSIDKNSSAYTYMSIKEGGLPVTGSYYTRSDQAVELLGLTGEYCYVRVEFWRTYLSDPDSTIFTIIANITGTGTPPSPPTLSSPANNSTGVSIPPTLSWSASTGATSYTLQVSRNSDLSSPLYNQSVGNNTSQQISGLSAGTTYYWRVNATNSGGTSGWSSTWSFTTVTSLSHFTVAYTNTGNNATVLVQTATTATVNNNSFTLASGDEIAIYTPSPDTLCCGVGIWSGSNIVIAVWGDNDQTTTIKEGFTAGQNYTFRLWDASESKEYGNAEATFSSGQSTYTANAISIASALYFTTFVELSLPLPSGWNMVSSNVIPQFTRMDSIFQNIVSKLVIAKNGTGKVFWPRYGINQIGGWNILEGYLVYMSASDTLKIRGQRATPSTPISLPAGWSMISYLPTIAMSPATACSSIVDKIVIMKDALGKVYWPQYGINQIGMMQSGKGYQIYLSSAGTLTYPASLSKEGFNLVENRNRNQMSPQHFSYIRGAGANATILLKMNEKLLINGTILEIGDEIGVYTLEGICAGAGVWNGDDIVIAIWGDNEQTTSIDGFTDGQAYNFKLWDKSANAEKDISVIAEYGNLNYTENGITVISYERSTGLPENFVLRQNYPNPFNPSTGIEYQIKTQSEVTLAIYNTAGQLIRMLVQSAQLAGVYSVEWDGKNSSGIQAPSGIYLYRLQAGSVIETRKMILMK